MAALNVPALHSTFDDVEKLPQALALHGLGRLGFGGGGLATLVARVQHDGPRLREPASLPIADHVLLYPKGLRELHDPALYLDCVF